MTDAQKDLLLRAARLAATGDYEIRLMGSSYAHRAREAIGDLLRELKPYLNEEEDCCERDQRAVG